MNRKNTPTAYFITPAPGHYGDASLVISSHRSFRSAAKAASAGYVIRRGALTKGARWFRSSESVYPIIIQSIP
jgi:hypothetical protein